MKICVNYGHAESGTGTGAVGLIHESKETRNVGKELVKLLKENSNHTIIVADFNGSDNYIKAKDFANKEKADLFVSIHFNAGANDKNGNNKTTGTETIVYKSTSKAMPDAKRIHSNIVKLGFRDRGVKTCDKLGKDITVLKSTTMPALLVECCFVDDADDVKLYDYKQMAKAIAEGVLNKTIVNEQPKPQDSKNTETWYRAVCGSFKSKDLAEKRIKELSDKGYEGCFVVAFEKNI